VIRLGEVSPNGRLFTYYWGFWKLQLKYTFSCDFFLSTRCLLILIKNVLGFILSDLFTNSSGHPDGSFKAASRFQVAFHCSNRVWPLFRNFFPLEKAQLILFKIAFCSNWVTPHRSKLIVPFCS
jgi:hypothetical protein